MDISRRQLALVVLASSAAAQTPPKLEADVDAARVQQRAAAQAIAQVPLPMTVEPAFQFKA